MPADLAGIEYIGVPGATKECVDAVIRLLQTRVTIPSAQILTSSRSHCILLAAESGELLAVKSGFSSGYAGTGPNGFSLALCLLDDHGTDIEEYDVDEALLLRVDMSALTTKDLRNLSKMTPVRPSRWFDYVREQHWDEQNEGKLWNRRCTPIMPYTIIDCRIFDLAKAFWEDPDKSLLTGYRRLEDLVRRRTGIKEHGTKLFTAAFHGNEPRLQWKDCHASEQQGPTQLFVGTVMAYRNPRAHKELEWNERDALVEFLLLNQLFLLEGKAFDREVGPEES